LSTRRNPRNAALIGGDERQRCRKKHYARLQQKTSHNIFVA
jgi:hypothetical protein